MTSITVNKITRLVNEAIEGTDLFIGEIKVKSGNIIYIFLDGDHGVPISKCVEVSRYVEKHLDREREDFELNVSSYGIGQPLKFLRQYVNAIGKQLTVTLQDGTKRTGILLQADDKQIALQLKSDKKHADIATCSIEMNTIKTAKIDAIFK